MKGRRARILAWGLSAIAILPAVLAALQWTAGLTGPPTLYDAVQHLGWGLAIPVVFSVLATMIIARQRGNRVGWLMMTIALALSPMGLAISLALNQLSGPPATMTAGLWLTLWLSTWLWALPVFLILLIPLYYPTGGAPSPRWRWVTWLAVAMWVLILFVATFHSEMGPGDADWTTANPLGFIPPGFEDLLGVVWGIGVMIVIAGSVASLFARYRRAGIGEQQQIKWLLLAAAQFALLAVLGLVFSDSENSGSGWMDLLLVLSILVLPVTIALAIFRYRLWDLDVVVNRALIYGLLTTALAGIFAAVIAVITEAGKDLLGEGSRAMGAAVSGLIVAVVFQPLRSWIEARVNTRFYPEKQDLATGLVEVRPEYWGFLDRRSLMEISLGHVRRILGTAHAAFFLAGGPGESRRAAEAGTFDGGSSSILLSEKQGHELAMKLVIAAATTGPLVGHVPVYVDRGNTNEVLGLLSIGARANGKGYSGDELRALADLGGKIGLALNAIQLGSISKGSALTPDRKALD